MKLVSIKKTFVLSFLLLTIVGGIRAQLVCTSRSTTQLVQNTLLGSGVTVSNITYNGAPIAIGFFDGHNSNIGLDSGVVLTSGDIQFAQGPNNTGGAGNGNNTPGDPQLDAYSSQQTFDAAVLEFDFVPQSDSIKFRYVFGSEEYLEFANSSFNDIFAFILSGVSVVMPAHNIALIPGTTTPVSINNINDINHPSLYVDNGDGWTTGGSSVQYDGFTKIMTAVAKVQCGETYHIKLAIADAFDGILDSGVFLEAGSFKSNGEFKLDSKITGGDAGENTCYESNGEIEICFTRGNSNITKAESAHFVLGGSALNGVDYDYLPDSVYFPVGIDSVCISIKSKADDVLECMEDITITIDEVDLCSNSSTSVLQFFLKDSCRTQIFYPNAFTPNRDGLNDVFQVEGFLALKFQMIIFDRWGNEVYTTNNIDAPWNGFVNGQLAPQGVYIFQLHVEGYENFVLDKVDRVTLLH